MKLAEALILRSDLQNKMEQLRYRLESNVMVQEGDDPSEDPNDLLQEYGKALEEFKVLVKRINRTNNQTELGDGISLSDALVDRDVLLKKRNILSRVAEEGTVKQDRYSRTELKYVSKVDIKVIQEQINETAKEYRELDTKIQGFNWTIDLI